MIRAATTGIVALAGLWSGAASAGFHPREDRPYRFDVSETRSADGVTRHFRTARSVVFHRTAAGYEAVVTLERIDQDAGGGVGGMFEAATAALLHRPIRYRLDAGGHAVGVADGDALIAAIADAIERIAAPPLDRPRRASNARALAEPLRSASPDRKTAMLLSILRPLLFADVGPVGTRAITVPSHPPLPLDTPLTGSETVTRTGDIATIETAAAGVLAPGLPATTPGTRFAPNGDTRPGVTIRATRTVDLATGLLCDGRETSDTVVPSEDGLRHAIVETVTRLRQATE